MIRSPDEESARRQDAHIANELGVTLDALDLHPFRLIDAGLGHDLPRWRILWIMGAPEGVIVHGSGDHRWSEIAAMPDTKIWLQTDE